MCIFIWVNITYQIEEGTGVLRGINLWCRSNVNRFIILLSVHQWYILVLYIIMKLEIRLIQRLYVYLNNSKEKMFEESASNQQCMIVYIQMLRWFKVLKDQ